MTTTTPTTTKSLGLWTCTALIIGNMIGSGFFIAPAALAPYGTVAIIGWGIMALAAVCLGIVFARLARIAPTTGGPYAYTRLGFGRFTGFLVAWGYWISIWASLPAMSAGLVGYLNSLFPVLKTMPGMNVLIGLGAIWLIASINIKGVKEAGIFQAATVYTKLIPFIGISVFGLFWVDWSHFAILNPSDKPFFSALAATAPLTMFAFLGIESATVPAGDVEDADKTIPRATILGTLVSSLVYILGTTVVLGVLPKEVLINSSAPFADAAHAMWGQTAATVISVAAIISSLGAINGWTLLMGQVPMAAARDGAMPKIFAKVNAAGSPKYGILISATLSSLLLLIDVSGGKAMAAFYNLIVDLSTDAAMIPYVFCCVVEGILFVKKDKLSKILKIKPYIPVGTVAFVFSVATIYGSGPTAGMWSLLLLMLAIPVWLLIEKENRESNDAR
ncbi:transporter [Vibrio parahaemolyticus]|uniref:amino acid permease n=1 Tax=Vibrio parahaemolyticus TaxID=670 RepID=UPI00084B69EE|nr:amino acid permease [Vibrio parahaemolyticus]EJC7015297.1 amino acid permease [Vibrio parahaemolyticus]ODY31264.1 transporter [Vibrio parahaemolyticus]